MDDGVDLPSQFLFSQPDPEMPAGTFDDLLSNASTSSCTHTHTCNAPGPSAAMHTHTCQHTHTSQVFATGSEDDDGDGDPAAKTRRPLGNREAVRKYREKKKARAAFLEEEVRKLRAANQQLLRRLQGHATLEAEAVRMRSLLLDVRAKIDAEVSVPAAAVTPLQKMPLPCSVGSVVCSDRPALCFNGNSEAGAWEESSRPAAADCRFEEDGNGGASREIDVLEQVHSMDVTDLCFHS